MAFIKKPPVVIPGAAQPSRSERELLTALNDSDAQIRKIAAHELALFANAAQALSERLGHEGNMAVRVGIVTALIKINTADAARGLIPYLRSEDVALRNDVIVALQQMPDRVMPYMAQLLCDDDHDVRIFAINILAAMHHIQAPSLLLRVIESDPHLNVCATALDTLAEIGTPDMIPAIQAVARRFDNDYLRFAADVAIHRITA